MRNIKEVINDMVDEIPLSELPLRERLQLLSDDVSGCSWGSS